MLLFFFFCPIMLPCWNLGLTNFYFIYGSRSILAERKRMWTTLLFWHLQAFLWLRQIVVIICILSKYKVVRKTCISRYLLLICIWCCTSYRLFFFSWMQIDWNRSLYVVILLYFHICWELNLAFGAYVSILYVVG